MNSRMLLLACLLPLAEAAAGGPPTGPAPLASAPLERFWNEHLSGGPGKDGIPSIDQPRFIPADQADAWLQPGDRVIGVYENGEAKAYPQRIVVWHEIVNDRVGGKNLSITYCPLTGTALGFVRGETEFGVSGLLVNSNLIMYDRATDSDWPQILGTAVQGPDKGKGLRPLRVFWTNWQRWRTRHPDTAVLSKDTGHIRNYRRDPYGSYNPRSGYYAEDAPAAFPVMHRSDHYPPKHVIFGFRTANEAVAVDRRALAAHGTLRYHGEAADFLILHDPGLDTAWIYRGPSGKLPADDALRDLRFTAAGPRSAALAGLRPVPGFEAMWFAWYAYYPNTAVVGGNAP